MTAAPKAPPLRCQDTQDGIRCSRTRAVGRRCRPCAERHERTPRPVETTPIILTVGRRSARADGGRP